MKEEKRCLLSTRIDPKVKELFEYICKEYNLVKAEVIEVLIIELAQKIKEL